MTVTQQRDSDLNHGEETFQTFMVLCYCLDQTTGVLCFMHILFFCRNLRLFRLLICLGF